MLKSIAQLSPELQAFTQALDLLHMVERVERNIARARRAGESGGVRASECLDARLRFRCPVR